jgi:hypothetical protein
VQPLRGAEGALDTLIYSEKTLTVAIDGFLCSLLAIAGSTPALTYEFRP